VLASCDPHRECIWEEEAAGLWDFKEGTVGGRMAHLTLAELSTTVMGHPLSIRPSDGFECLALQDPTLEISANSLRRRKVKYTIHWSKAVAMDSHLDLAVD
jgi:hypothetical protein